ncbi:hypothetical protein AB9P05_05500 [Roseivirga sp. BDSF3-8]|uniref:hypothetical protein n=1 Tax=Roseivirga sp. BDSF3-8 TaxID=3241598 RepID=UPI003531B46F
MEIHSAGTTEKTYPRFLSRVVRLSEVHAGCFMKARTLQTHLYPQTTKGTTLNTLLGGSADDIH